MVSLKRTVTDASLVVSNYPVEKKLRGNHKTYRLVNILFTNQTFHSLIASYLGDVDQNRFAKFALKEQGLEQRVSLPFPVCKQNLLTKLIKPLKYSHHIDDRLLKIQLTKHFQSAHSTYQELTQLFHLSDSLAVKIEIIHQLGDLSSDEAIKALGTIAFSKDYSRPIALQALKALSNTETKQALDLLENNLHALHFEEEIEAHILCLALKMGSPISREVWKKMGIKNAALKLFSNFSFQEVDIYQKAFETLYALATENMPSKEAQDMLIYAANNFEQSSLIHEMSPDRWNILKLAHEKLVKLGNDEVIASLKKIIESTDNLHTLLAGQTLVKIGCKRGIEELQQLSVLKNSSFSYAMYGALLEKSQHADLKREEIASFFELISSNHHLLGFEVEQAHHFSYERDPQSLTPQEFSCYDFQELLDILSEEKALDILLENEEEEEEELDKIANDAKLNFLIKKGLLWNLSQHQLANETLLSYILSPSTPLCLKITAMHAYTSLPFNQKKRKELLNFFQHHNVDMESMKSFISILVEKSNLGVQELSMLIIKAYSSTSRIENGSINRSLKHLAENNEGSLNSKLLASQLITILGQELENSGYNVIFVASVIKLMLSLDKDKSSSICYYLLKKDAIAEKLIGLYKDDKRQQGLAILLLWMHRNQGNSLYLSLLKKAPDQWSNEEINGFKDGLKAFFSQKQGLEASTLHIIFVILEKINSPQILECLSLLFDATLSDSFIDVGIKRAYPFVAQKIAEKFSKDPFYIFDILKRCKSLEILAQLFQEKSLSKSDQYLVMKKISQSTPLLKEVY